jgi:small-conductance mechanosensitive channel
MLAVTVVHSAVAWWGAAQPGKVRYPKEARSMSDRGRFLRILTIFAALAAISLSSAAEPAAARPRATRPDSLPVAASRSDSLATDSLRFAAAGRDSLDADSVAAAALVQKTLPAASESTSLTPVSSAPVFLGGHEVFRVRVGLDGLDPAQRAAAIRRRLNQAVADKGIPADSVRLVPTSGGVEVRLGLHFLWLVTSGDLSSRDPAVIAAQLAELTEQVREGIHHERAGRTPLRLSVSIVIAIALTIVVWIFFRLLLVGGRRTRASLGRRLRGRLPPIRWRGFEVFSRVQFMRAIMMGVGLLEILVILILVYAYLTAVFSRFPWTQGWSWQLAHFATQRTLAILKVLLLGLPGLFTIAVVVILFRWLVKVSDRFFDAVESGAIHLGTFHPELARPSRRMAKIGLWIFALLVAYPYIPGSSSKAVQGASLLIGLMLSLGSTGFVGNMIAGLVLTYSRSFRVGDRVRLGEHVGDVVNLGFFATKLRSIRNEEITIPNGAVASGAIVNYTRLAHEGGLILHTEVTIGYDAEWRRVHALLIEAAERVSGVEREPAAWVYQRSLNDYHVSYELNCVTRDPHAQLRLYSDLHAEIQDAFSRAGIEILSPSYQAIRDANAPALPAEPTGPRPQPGGFRIRENP